MRDDRRWRQWTAAAAGLAVLCVLALASSSPVTGAATPTPTSTPTATPSPTETPSPTQTPCQEAFAQVDGGDLVVRGDIVRVRFVGFAPNAGVTLMVLSADVTVQIGAGTADAQGRGVVQGVIPAETPIGVTQLDVVSDQCIANAYVVILGSPEQVTIDDDTVIPGQRVTLRAGGFMENGHVVVSIDTFPTQGECWPRPCRYLGTGTTSAVGSVVIHVRIPRDTAPGEHSLWVSGYMAGGEREDSLGVDITVVGGTLPPTDTEG
jgi:hypothetical protein